MPSLRFVMEASSIPHNTGLLRKMTRAWTQPLSTFKSVVGIVLSFPLHFSSVKGNKSTCIFYKVLYLVRRDFIINIFLICIVVANRASCDYRSISKYK